ncbi:acetamidase, partial [Mycobacterium sp. ITM-2017-0098]
AGAGVAGVAAACSSEAAMPAQTPSSTAASFSILQPGEGDPVGDHYLQSVPDEVLWGYVPTVHAEPVMRMASGETVTIDAVSHEGILEDQGRNPVEYFGAKGVAESDVLQDAIAIAS